MPQDLVTLYNQACGMVGEKLNISSPDEESRPAETCEMYYDLVVRQIQSSARWDCVQATAQLSLHSYNEDNGSFKKGAPPRRWKYAYKTPNDMLRPWHLDDYQQFELGMQDGIRLLYTNSENPVLEYAVYEPAPERFAPQLYSAVVAALAAYISKPLTGSRAKAADAQDQANALITEAQMTEANSDQTFEQNIPTWIAARDFTGGLGHTPYVYPHGPMLSIVSGNVTTKAS